MLTRTHTHTPHQGSYLLAAPQPPHTPALKAWAAPNTQTNPLSSSSAAAVAAASAALPQQRYSVELF